MTVLNLCATCGNHGTTGTGRDRKPCPDCDHGREIAAILDQGRAAIAALTEIVDAAGDADEDEWAPDALRHIDRIAKTALYGPARDESDAGRRAR